MNPPSPPSPSSSPPQGARAFVPADFARALAIACEEADRPLPSATPHDHTSLNAAGEEVGIDKKVLADALWRAQMEKLSVRERNDLGLEKAGKKFPIIIGAMLAVFCVAAAALLIVLFAQGRAAPRITGDIDEAALSTVIDDITTGTSECAHDGAANLTVGLRIGTEAQLLDQKLEGDTNLADCIRETLTGAPWPPAMGAPVDVVFTISVE